MPVGAYAQDNTCRYKVKYRVLGATHNVTFRMPRFTLSTELDGLRTKLTAVFAALAPNLYNNFSILSASYAREDSNVFLPTAAPDSPTGALSPAGVTQAAKALAAGFIGRTVGGRRAEFFIYGTNWNAVIGEALESDFRLTSIEVGTVSDVVDALNELSPQLVGIDNSPATWYEYTNLKFNDYVVRKLRQG